MERESGVTFRIVDGETLSGRLQDIARLRIDIFRDYPYLYDGTMAYEEQYLQTYLQPGGFAVLVEEGGETVGAGTGIPLALEAEEFKAPFRTSNYDLSSIFYIGELVLLPSYRRRGLGRRLLTECERQAVAVVAFEHFALATVERPYNHPDKPLAYASLDSFWEAYGYVRMPRLKAMFPWQDVGAAEETLKPMIFWLKANSSHRREGMVEPRQEYIGIA